MIVLGIETSGLDGSIALLHGHQCLGERALNQTGRRHAQALVLEIGELLTAHGLTPREVECVAVSRGPGSFTGLRVGMVCAKTFAYATGCRFVSVDTFQAIAENAPSQVARITVVEDAQRDDLFAGAYQRLSSGEWKLTAPIRIVSVDEFLREEASDSIVIGPGLRKLDPEQIAPQWLTMPESAQPKAAVIAALGQRLIHSSTETVRAEDQDFWKASPFYLRMSAAEEKRAADDEAKIKSTSGVNGVI